MLTEKDIIEYKEVKNKYEEKKQIITNYITEIIKTIHKVYGRTFKGSWWFHDAGEGEVGTIDLNHEEIDYELGFYHKMGNEYWDYSSGFPKDFLFMSIDDIVDSIKAENKKSDDLKSQKQIKVAEAKAKKEALKKSALSKLTKEEKKALKA